MNLSNFLQGQLDVEISAPFPQRLLNLAAQDNLLFWALRWNDATHISLSIPKTEYKHMEKLAKQIGAEVKATQTHGLPAIAQRFRHRFGFLLGLACSLLTVGFLSQFILIIEIEGNDSIPTAILRSALEEAGLYVGVYGPSLSLSNLPQGVLAELDGIAWMSVNLSGTRALVQIRETIAPPEILPTQGLYDIVARSSGVIEQIQAHKGQAMVVAGDTVTEGQLLIRGTVQLTLPLYSQDPPKWFEVPSSGLVYARTWHEITAVIPLMAQVKSPSGLAENTLELALFGRRWSFFENDMIFSENYDKIRHSSHLPRLEEFPVAVAHISETPYLLQETPLNRNVGRSLLEESLLEELQRRIAPTGEVLSTSFQAVEKDGLLQVTLLAECREEIGETVQGTPLPIEETEEPSPD